MNPFKVFYQSYDPFQTLLLVVAIGIIFFIIAREFWCWYFKSNKILKEIERINQWIESQSTIEKESSSEDISIK